MQSYSGSSPGGGSPKKPGVGWEERKDFFNPEDGRAGGGLCRGWAPPAWLGAGVWPLPMEVLPCCPVAHPGVCGSACPRLATSPFAAASQIGVFFLFPGVFFYSIFLIPLPPVLKRGQLPVAGKARCGEEEEEEGLAWRARQPSAIPLFAPAATWASAVRPARGPAAGGAPAPGRCWALGEHKARSPALPGVRGSLLRNKEGEGPPCQAVPGKLWPARALLSGSGQWGGVRSGRRVLGTSETFLFS